MERTWVVASKTSCAQITAWKKWISISETKISWRSWSTWRSTDSSLPWQKAWWPSSWKIPSRTTSSPSWPTRWKRTGSPRLNRLIRFGLTVRASWSTLQRLSCQGSWQAPSWICWLPKRCLRILWPFVFSGWGTAFDSFDLPAVQKTLNLQIISPFHIQMILSHCISNFVYYSYFMICFSVLKTKPSLWTVWYHFRKIVGRIEFLSDSSLISCH